MNSITIFLYIFFVYGLSNLLVFGSGPWNILGKLRECAEKILPTLGDMLKCMMCTSANIGWITSLLNILILPSTPLTPYFLITGGDVSLWPIIIFADMCFASGTTWLIHTLQEMLERIENYDEQ